MTAMLRPGVVHVSWGRVGALAETGVPLPGGTLSPGGIHSPGGMLSKDEEAKAERMAEGLARRQFVAGRALLRATLARATGRDPRTFHLHYGERGKPFLPQGPPFSLSHSGDWVVAAVGAGAAGPGPGATAGRGAGAAGPAGGGRLGVDVEVVRPVRRMEAVVRRRFAPEEAEWWAGLPAGRRRAGFFQLWTRKEALAKALGDGLAAPWQAFAVAAADGGLRRLDLPGERADQWSVVGLRCGRGVAAAVAADWPATVLTLRIRPCP